MNVELLRDRLYETTGQTPKGTGAQWSARCPAHHDRNASLSVHVGEHAIAIHCHAGCDKNAIVDALSMTWHDFFATPKQGKGDRPWMPCVSRQGHRVAMEFAYRYADHKDAYWVLRCDHKCFAQCRPDATKKSGRTWNLEGVERVPYRLPEVLAELATEVPANIWVVEGEKDADRLWSMGYPATCNSGGAGKWTAHEHAKYLTGADVMVVADRDAPGRTHAQHVVSTLLPIARSVEVLQARAGKDVSDHLDAGLRIVDLASVAYPLLAPEIGLDGLDLPRAVTT